MSHPIRLEKVNKIEIKKSVNQESHHALHALTFFYMAIHSTLEGKRVRRRLLGRMIHHLMDLREFLEEGPVNDLANDLLITVQEEYAESLFGPARSFFASIASWDQKGKGRFLSSLCSFMIACSERTSRPAICLYPWIVRNRENILGFADYYGRRSMFEKMIPMTRSGPVFHG